MLFLLVASCSRLPPPESSRSQPLTEQKMSEMFILQAIGVPEGLIHVTADPVIRVKKPDPAQGLALLEREGCPPHQHVHAPDDGQGLLRQVFLPQAPRLAPQALRHAGAHAHILRPGAWRS